MNTVNKGHSKFAMNKSQQVNVRSVLMYVLVKVRITELAISLAF